MNLNGIKAPALRGLLRSELETNAQHTARITKLEKICNDQESAFRGQEATIRQLTAERDKARTRESDLTAEVHRLNHRCMELSADARTSDQNTALIEEKYKAALEIIRIISGKEGF